MGLTHKTKVVLQYLIPLAFVYAALAATLFSNPTFEPSTVVKYLGGTATLAVVMALVQDIIPKPIKEAWVFWRIRHRLPGHRAFDLSNDRPDRFDRKKIKNIVGLAAATPEEQQRSFYKIYKKVAKRPAVAHCSFRYLAWRDTAAASMALGIVTVPALGFLTASAFWPSMKLATIMALISVVAAFAAREMGNELVNHTLSAHTLEKA